LPFHFLDHPVSSTQKQTSAFHTFPQSLSFRPLLLYQQSYTAGHLSISEISISQTYTSLNAITEANPLALRELVSQREKEVMVACVHAPVYLCVFHLYKQSSSDNYVSLKMEHAAIFSSP